MTEDPPPEVDLEWENRRLCADGNCIGVIGPDGLCKECAKPYDEAAGETAAEDPAQAADEEPESVAAEPLDVPAADPEEPRAPEASDAADGSEEHDDDAWKNRRLCPDGNCIGVIGSDGRCKECGKPADDFEDD